MVKNVEERIARIKQQREALAQRLNALEQKSKSESRKRDTRRKIIVGGAIMAKMEKDPGFAATCPRQILAQSVGRQNDREAIADLLAAASGIASPAAPEKTAVAPAPAPRVNAPGMDSAKPDVSGVAPLAAKSDALAAFPQSQPPRPPAPPFLMLALNPQSPPPDPLASTIDDFSRMLGRKSE